MARSYGAFPGLLNPASLRILPPMPELLIDAQYMKSPLPVLRAARALRGMAAGAKLRLLVTDPATGAELRAFCKTEGHAMVASSEAKGVFSFTIRRKPDAATAA